MGPYLRVFVLLMVLLIMESALPSSWPHPDVCLLLLVPLAFRAGRLAGGMFGFASGALLAILGSGVIGLFAGVYGAVGYILGIAGELETEHNYLLKNLGMAFGVFAVGLMLTLAFTFFPYLGGPASEVLRSWFLHALIWNLLFLWPFERLFTMCTGARAFRRPGLKI